jgi:O-antigen/teichoic acid export membrane protein
MTLLGSLSHLGLGTGLIRYLPGAAERRAQLMNVALTVAALSGVAAATVFLAGLPLWSPSLSYLLESPLYMLAFVVFAGAATAATVPVMSMVALRRAHHVLAIGIVAQMVRMALPAAFLSFGAFGIVASGGLSALLNLVAGIFLLALVSKPYRPRPAIDASSASLLVPYGLANQAADLALNAPSLLLPVMVVNTLGAESSAHFYIGFFLGALVLTGVQSLATSLFAEGSYDEGSLASTARRALMGCLLISGIAAVLMMIAGDKLLLVFGRSYSSEATGLSRWVAAAALPASLTYVYLAVQRVRKRMKAMVAVSWSVCLVTLGLSYFLVPKIGITGPGIGMLCGYGVGALLGVGHLASSRTSAVAEGR